MHDTIIANELGVQEVQSIPGSLPLKFRALIQSSSQEGSGRKVDERDVKRALLFRSLQGRVGNFFNGAKPHTPLLGREKCAHQQDKIMHVIQLFMCTAHMAYQTKCEGLFV